MATISDFAANFRGGVRPNLFRVDIQGPQNFADFHFFCKGAQVPASTIATIPVPYRGRQLQVPGDRTYEEWTVTVLNDVNWQYRSSFEQWSQRITAHNANVTDFGDGVGFYGRATVIHLDRSGNTLRRYVVEDIFPTTIAAIDLTTDANDTVEEYTVSFAINSVTIDGLGIDGGSSGLGVNISASGSINLGGVSISGII